MDKSNDEILLMNLKRILTDKGIKQCKVASSIGLSDTEFSRLMAGKRVIRACYIPGIVHALGVTPNELFAVEGEGS